MSIKSILSRLTLILFGTLVGVLLIAGLELSLRFLWDPVDSPEHLLLVSSIDPFTQNADQYVTRGSFLEAIRPSSFAVDKHPDTFRIFAFGGSATFGYPYPAEYSWPSVLQNALRSFYPHRKIEVINLGGTSYGTSRVIGLLRGIVKYQPDLVIIYSGNNEFVEDSYQEQIIKQSEEELFIKSLYLTRAYHQLAGENIFKNQVKTVSVEDGDSREFFFSPTVDGSIYQPTTEQKTNVLTRYRNNISAMAALCSANDIPMVLATVASNLSGWAPDTRDSATNIPQKLAWQKQLQQAEQALSRDDKEAAIDTYKLAYNIFQDHAATNYTLGTLLAEKQDYKAALPYLIQARDHDPAPVRATSALNKVVRTLAAQHKLPLADVAQRALEIAPNGIPGDTLFIDYVHPTRVGNIHIAQTVSETLLASDAFPSIENAKTESFWAEQLAEISNPPPMDVNITFTWGQIYLRKGQLDKAEELLRSTIAQGYDHPSASLFLAEALSRQGKIQEAFQITFATYQKHPEYSEAYPLLAHLSRQMGRNELAITAYTKVIESGRPTPDNYAALTLALLQERRSVEAEKILNKGLAVFPEDCHLNASYGRILELQDQLKKAEASYQNTLKSDPSCQAGWENLGLLQMNQQRFDEAVITFHTAIKQPGSIPSHHLNLGIAYHFSGGHPDKARAEFMIVAEQGPDLIRYIPSPYREEVLAGRGSNE